MTTVSTAAPFLLDSDVFIAAKNAYYAFDICPGFLEGTPPVVTNEQPRPESRNRVLLPDVCGQFNVRYKDTFVMLRELAIQFDIVGGTK